MNLEPVHLPAKRGSLASAPVSRAIYGMALWSAFVFPALADAPPKPGRVLSVGPGKTYARPSQAAAAVQDGDTVEIDAGAYSGDVAVWRASRLTLRGKGGQAVLNAQGQIAEGKAIWVIKGDDTRVENIEFTGASVPDHNGAGIRQEGQGLTVTRCLFHDNEDGILADASPEGDIVIENSEFRHNGQGDGYSHNMYIGHVRSFTLRGCWSHDAHAGHDVKSRASINTIEANRIGDDDGSDTSYLLDFPNGGECRVIGNVFERGRSAANGTLINFAEEGPVNPKQELYLVNNTLVNDRPNAAYVRVAHSPTVRFVNNLFLGPGGWLSGDTVDMAHNLSAKPADFRDAAKGDYHLLPGSEAREVGTDPGKEGNFILAPRLEYAAPVGTFPRLTPTPPWDLGAFGFQERIK